ncbi:hypothetical protein J2X35_003585 [Mesorhizobium sp. BE184]|nr:hypothetical protein [Mesorhizobium sp. BE184]
MAGDLRVENWSRRFYCPIALPSASIVEWTSSVKRQAAH